MDGQALDVGAWSGWLVVLAAAAGAPDVDPRKARRALARRRRNLGIGVQRVRKGRAS